MAVISEKFDNLGADGSPVRLGILGGTFDPIHIGHLAMADEMRAEIGLDAVLFIPNNIPVFKRNQSVTEGRYRLEMCRLAVKGNPFFDVSAIELDRGGDTYTIDTLRKIREHYSENVELYLMAASDSAATIGKWKSSEEIARLVHVAVAERPGHMFDDAIRNALQDCAPFDIICVQVTKLSVSSTDIRERINKGLPVRYLLTESVWSYIHENCLYGASSKHLGEERLAIEDPCREEPFDSESDRECDDVPDDALTDEFFEARRLELADRVGKKRYKHVMGVVEAADALARRYGVDVRKARLAGLLHDWDKAMDDDEARARVKELGLEGSLDPFVVEHMPRVLHAHTAAAALRRDFPQIPEDVLQAIDRHTVAAEDMEPLDMVVYIADALEPGRKFGRIDELRAAAETCTLEQLYFKTYAYWVFLLLERGKTFHPDTMRIWNSNVLRQEQAEKSEGKHNGRKPE